MRSRPPASTNRMDFTNFHVAEGGETAYSYFERAGVIDKAVHWAADAVGVRESYIQDLRQEICLALHRRRLTSDADFSASPMSWLLGTAHHMAMQIKMNQSSVISSHSKLIAGEDRVSMKDVSFDDESIQREIHAEQSVSSVLEALLSEADADGDCPERIVELIEQSPGTLDHFPPGQWRVIRAVLTGETGRRAAKRAGINQKSLRNYIERMGEHIGRPVIRARDFRHDS